MIVHYMLGIETILETATLKIYGNFENTFGKIDCSELYFKLENDKNSDLSNTSQLNFLCLLFQIQQQLRYQEPKIDFLF